MKRVRTLIVDDESLARERLRDLLRPFREIEVIGEAEDGEAAIEMISQDKPDLVFLDIQMPGCTGIEVAASMPPGRPRVIFCTAYDQYAIDAFDVNAVDYLLKPVNRVRLARAIERILGQNAPAGPEQAIRTVAPARFLAKRGGKFSVIPVSQVTCFLSEEGLTQLCTQEQCFWMEPTLNDLEGRLESAGFFRVSRQALVNLNRVEEVLPLPGSYGRLRLKGGRTVDVSRRRMKPLMERLECS